MDVMSIKLQRVNLKRIDVLVGFPQVKTVLLDFGSLICTHCAYATPYARRIIVNLVEVRRRVFNLAAPVRGAVYIDSAVELEVPRLMTDTQRDLVSRI